MPTTLSNRLFFFFEKMLESFAMQQKIHHICYIYVLTNDVVNFEQLDPGGQMVYPGSDGPFVFASPDDFLGSK